MTRILKGKKWEEKRRGEKKRLKSGKGRVRGKKEGMRK